MSPSSDAPRAIQPTREVHLRDYWKIAWLGRWTVVGAFAAVVGVTALYTFLQTPIYKAVATVQIDSQARRLGPGQDVSGMGVSGYSWFAEERYQNTQLEIIRSRAVAERALRELGLRTAPEFQNLPDPVATFQRTIRVEPRRETGLVDISIEGTDPKEVARRVNAVAEAYVERNLERAQSNAEKAVQQLRKLLDPLKRDLSAAETDRMQVLRDAQIYNPDSQQAIVRLRLEKLNSELAAAQIEVARLRGLIDKVDELRRTGADPTTIPELSKDTVLQDLSKQRVELEKQLEVAKVTYRPGAPAYQEKVNQLQRLQRRISDQIALVLGGFQNEFELRSRNESELRAKIREAEESSFNLGLATSRYEVVKTDAESKKQILDAITKTTNEVALSAELISNNVTLLDGAIPPLNPIRPRKFLNLVLGAMIGFFAGVGLVFFLDYLDNTIRSPEDVERDLRLTTLALVPRQAEGETAGNAVREAYQTLRTSIIFSSRGRERRVVLFTSSMPQEGKSSTAANVARALAGAGERVIVLDCDLRRPTQHVHFGLERDHGLTNFLSAPAGTTDWSTYLKRDPKIPSLHVLTCGPIPPNPPDLLGSERFAALIRELRSTYDWVVIDSPPAASLADATLLSAMAEMVVIVVRHNSTDRDLVSRSVTLLRNVGANVIGAVLNNIDINRAWRKDHYYAGYYNTDEGRGTGGKRGGRGSGPERAAARSSV